MPLTFGEDIICPVCHGKGTTAYGECVACRGTGIHKEPPKGPPAFDGETYEPERDGDRLEASLGRIRAAMADGRWWTLPELAHAGECSPAGASARLRDLRKPKFGGHTVERRYRGDGVWEYRLTSATTAERE